MREYWNMIADKCYYLRKGKSKSLIKKFNGQQFYKISE